MASFITDAFKTGVLQKQHSLNGTTDTIKVALYTSTLPASGAAAAAAYSATGEVYGGGAGGLVYTAGGATLTSKSVTGSTTATFDAADVTWASSTITSALWALIYNDSATPKQGIACIDFGTAKSSSAGDFTITWSGSGILTLAG